MMTCADAEATAADEAVLKQAMDEFVAWRAQLVRARREEQARLEAHQFPDFVKDFLTLAGTLICEARSSQGGAENSSSVHDSFLFPYFVDYTTQDDATTVTVHVGKLPKSYITWLLKTTCFGVPGRLSGNVVVFDRQHADSWFDDFSPPVMQPATARATAPKPQVSMIGNGNCSRDDDGETWPSPGRPSAGPSAGPSAAGALQVSLFGEAKMETGAGTAVKGDVANTRASHGFEESKGGEHVAAALEPLPVNNNSGAGANAAAQLPVGVEPGFITPPPRTPIDE